MEWLFIWGLVIFAAVLHSRVGKLERRIEELTGTPPGERYDPPIIRPAPPPPAPVMAKAAEAPPAPAPEPAPMTPAEPERPYRTEPRPPPPSRTAPEPAAPTPIPEPVMAAPVIAAPIIAERAPLPPRAAAPEKPPVLLSTWLAENGLAWLGGGALALGGLFLVVIAVQRGFFTPAMRIAAALVLGGAMLAASEWIRRQKDAPGGRHLLASGAAAGAGGATLYGALWAAYALYGLIPFEVAAVLIAATSLGLLAYALLQGEAIAVLALAGAFTTPLMSHATAWSPDALEAYLVAIIATGYGFSALRRWTSAAYATLAGAMFWTAPWLIMGPVDRGAVLLVASVIGAVAAGAWARRRQPVDQPAPNDAFYAQAASAIVLAAFLSIIVWLAPTERSNTALTAVGLSIALAIVAGVAAGRRLIAPGVFAAPVASAAIGIAYAQLFHLQRLTSQPEPLIVLPAAIAAIGLVAALGARAARVPLLAIGGIGAAVLATMIWPILGKAHFDQAWLPAAVTAGAMFAAGWLVARTSDDARTDRGLALWLAGAAELLFLAVYAAIDPTWAPAAQGLAALALALAAMAFGWRGLAQGAVAGGLVALASMMRPAFIGAVMAGTMPVGQLALVAALAAALTFAAGRLLVLPASRAEKAGVEAQALGAAALLIALLGAFLVIHRWTTAANSEALGQHFEASLRTVLLLAAALMLALRARPDDSAFSQFRLRAMLIAGIAHGLLLQAWPLSPWWGLGETPIGPPVVNVLLIGYLAPAGILFAIHRRGLPGQVAWARTSAAAGILFAMLWAILAVRQAVHPGDMRVHEVGRSEACAYAIVALGAALAFLWLRLRTKASPDARGGWLASAALPAAWLALGWSAVVFWVYASPWWGGHTEPFNSQVEVAALFALYGLGAAATLAMVRLAGDQPGAEPLPRAALTVAVFDIFVLVTLIVRWSFHGLVMARAHEDARIETWTFSAVWALFGLGVLMLGGARRNFTLRWLGLIILLGSLLKVLMFDMSRLDGVVRAGSFLAVGALLLVGALAARRLNAGALLFNKKAVTAEPT